MPQPSGSYPLTSIAGYHIEGVLGRGGMGEVYVARQTSVDRRVALKVFRVGQLGGGANTVDRLSREAKLLARLDHENVVRCIDFGHEEGVFYLVLELVEGESLKDKLDREGVLSEGEAARIAFKVAQGLEHAHQNDIVHRDVKPGNVLLARDGRVKLTDFGLARGAEDLELTRPGTTVGTPQYLSPEQARDPRTADARSDLYSLGATFYHMVTGRLPHRGESLTEVLTQILFAKPTPADAVAPNLSPAVSRVIARLMAKDPRRRYNDTREFRDDLRRALTADASERNLPGISWDQSGRGAGKPKVIGRAVGTSLVVLTGAAILVIGITRFSPWFDEPPDEIDPNLASSVEGSSPFDRNALLTGTLTPTDAWEALSAAGTPDSDPLRSLVLEEVDQGAERVMAHAGDVARGAVASGRLAEALAEYDRAAADQCRRSIGAEPTRLVAAFRDRVENQLAPERRRIQQLTTTARREVDEAIRTAFDDARRRVLADLDAGRFRTAASGVREFADGVDAVVRREFAGVIRELVPEAAEPSPSDEWVGDAAAVLSRAVSVLEKTVERRVGEARQGALDAVAAADPKLDSAVGEAEFRVALELAAEQALGASWSELPGEPGPLAAAIESRLETRRAEVARSEADARRELERELAVEIEAALRTRDHRRVRDARKRMGDREPSDAWLIVLVAAAPQLEEVERRVLDSYAEQIGSRIRLMSGSIQKTGDLAAVDRIDGRLRFGRPPFQVSIDDLPVTDWVQRAGGEDLVPSLARALLHLFRDEANEVTAVLDGPAAADADWRPAVRARWAQIEEDREQSALVAESAAAAQLDAFDAALAAAVRDPQAIVDLGAPLLDSKWRRSAAIRPHLARIKGAVETGRAELSARGARDRIAEGTRAEVRFLDDDQVELEHRFDAPEELEDFELPGVEWRWHRESLTSVGDGEVPKDLYRNRPGVRRDVPFDPERAIRAEFDLDLPYEQANPGLVGFRLLSACFVVRSFEGEAYPGQVNGWAGDLDEFEGFIFEPALGQTRPRNRRAGAVREFSLRRGNRYRVELEWRPGPRPETVLWIDGSVVYRFLGPTEQKDSGVEIRAETPITIDEMRLRGTMP